MIKGTYKQKPETIAKRVLKLKGKKRTPEQRKRISESHMGQKPWNKGITGSKSHFYGRKMSEENRKQLSIRTSGKNNHFWKGGVTPINKRLKQSSKYILWRKSVFERDNWTCQNCRIRGGELHPHHIRPFSLFPELRFDIDNGLTLCAPCHRQTDTYGSKLYKLNRKNKQ